MVDKGDHTVIEFDCPKCLKHRIEIPPDPYPVGWAMTGSIEENNVTLTPSIAHTAADGCKSHFWVRNGDIEMTA